MTKKIGLFGGTFDPIHLGHLIMAEEVYEKLNLDEVWFIPSYVPPHKKEATTDAVHRLNMVSLAIEGNSHFKLSDIELKRTGKSYTFDTITQLIQLNPTYEYFFIIGADMVEYLPKWNRIDELIKIVQFVGVKRNGYRLHTTYPIIEVNAPLIDISSTLLRERLISGETTKYLLTKEVNQYIREKGLYGS
jgi:nicotinate-nucleotide adenylyltransferase